MEAQARAKVGMWRGSGLAAAAIGLLVCLGCDRATDDLAQKSTPWAAPLFADAAAFSALEAAAPGDLCTGHATATFDRQGYAVGYVMDLEADANLVILARVGTEGGPAVDTVMALYGPADLEGFFGSTPLAIADDSSDESGAVDVEAAIALQVPKAGRYFLYVSTFDGAGRGDVSITAGWPPPGAASEWICRVDCGGATELASLAELVAAIPAGPWTCNPGSTAGPWPVTGDLCASVPLDLRRGDLPTPNLAGACGTGEFNSYAFPVVDPAITSGMTVSEANLVSDVDVADRVTIGRGTRFRLRTASRLVEDLAGSSAVLASLTFLAASDVPCADETWRCDADKVCYDRTIDGVFDPAYLYCLGCDRLPADQCACRSGKQAAADGTVCSVPQGEGVTAVTGTCGGGTCKTAVESPCPTLPQRWQSLLGDPANLACAEDSDCRLVGGNASCDAAPSLGRPSGTAVASTAASRFQALLDEFASGACDSFRAGQPAVGDASPARKLRCEEGTCRADVWKCSIGTPRVVPFVEEWDEVSDLAAAGWTSNVEGTSTASHWSVATEGGLGPDAHLAFSGTPDANLLSATASSPAIEAAAALGDAHNTQKVVTVQWRSEYQSTGTSPAVTLTVRGSNAADESVSAVLWSATTSSSDFALQSVTLPAELKALDALQLGFTVETGGSAVATGRWDIDRVVVAAGVPNEFVRAQVIRCLGNGSDCLSVAGSESLGWTQAPMPIPTLAMDPCEHWKVVLCYRDPDANRLAWNAYGFPSLSLEGAPLEAPAFVTADAAVGQANGCETSPFAVKALCGLPANLEDGYFACVADVDPDCQAASAGESEIGLVVRDEYDPMLTVHSPLESLVRVRVRVAQAQPKACVRTDDCANANPCDADYCVDGFCRHSAYNIVPGCCHAPTDRSPITGLEWGDELARQSFADGQCDDRNACTADSCDQATSLCVATEPAPGCCASAASCDDGDLCTLDTCVDSACQHARVSETCCTGDADCDDENSCTTDRCIVNSCRSVWDAEECCIDAATCDDQDPCTTDTCGTDKKCGHAPISGCVPA